MSEVIIMNVVNPTHMVGYFLLGAASMAAVFCICYMIRDGVLGRKEKED